MTAVKRVLLVVPDASLPHANDEIQAVVNSGLSVRLLNTNVTEDAISNELMRTDYDVLWFATHAEDDGDDGRIWLSSEKYIGASALVQLCRGTKLRLIYLNTCSSFGIASAIQEETDLTVICTINNIDDYLAYRTGALFARRLAQIGDYRSAFEAAKPGRNRSYVFLGSYKRWQRLNDEILHLLQKMEKNIDAIAAYLGIQEQVEKQVEMGNNRRMIAAIMISVLSVAFAIMFLAFRLAG